MKKRISLQQLTNSIDNTLKKCENIEPMLSEVAMQLEYKTQDSFEKEQDSFGNKWAPLSKQTLKSKKGNKILTESSTLQSSINSRTSLQRSKQGVRGKVSIGTNIEYAKIHQFGGQAGKGLKVKIPARPFLPIDNNKIPDDLMQDIKAAILRHLNIKA